MTESGWWQSKLAVVFFNQFFFLTNLYFSKTKFLVPVRAELGSAQSQLVLYSIKYAI